MHIGTVMNCNKDTKEYTVKYSDENYNKMMHRELVKHKYTTYNNALNMLKRLKEKQQANSTVQQSTAVPLPQHYAQYVWDYY